MKDEDEECMKSNEEEQLMTGIRVFALLGDI
jgi:hypothetical protein